LGNFEIIERQDDLESLASDLLKQKVVAVDTEADSFYHYFDKTCLVQVGTVKGCWLIDPLALGGPAALAPLGEVFASPDVRVLFHAAEYDIFVLKRDCGFSFANLFDTMVSAQLLGYRAVGLAALVEKHFDVKLPKDEQRSDWSRRPLTDKQLGYAASDVEFLIRLSELLENELREKQRLEWAVEEFQALTLREWPKRTFDKLGYLRIKGARSLDPEALSVLRELFLLRDQRAREIDRPPFKVLGNRTLLEIAEAKPRSLAALSEIKGMTDLIMRRMGREVMTAVREGRKTEHGPIPKATGSGRRRMDRRSEKRLDSLKQWRRKCSAEVELDPGVLCPNSTLETIALNPPESHEEMLERPELKQWFARSFGAEIVSHLQSSDVD
jgi:ribonuclease D